MLLSGLITSLLITSFFIFMVVYTAVDTKKRLGECGWAIDLIIMSVLSSWTTVVLWLQI